MRKLVALSPSRKLRSGMEPQRTAELVQLAELGLKVLATDRAQIDTQEREYAHVILTGALRELGYDAAFKSLDDLKKQHKA